MTAINDTVKKALRIKHDKLDDEVTRLINAARDEMIRAGVAEEVVTEGGSLVNQAVVTFCLMSMTEEKDLIDRYENSFRLQVDNIRKSGTLRQAPAQPGEDPAEGQEQTEENDVQ